MQLPWPFSILQHGEKNEDAEFVYSLGQSLAIASTQQSPSDVEMRKELDINIHMIEDEGLIKKLDSLCTIELKRLLYNQDGSIAMKQVEGKAVPVFTTEHVPRPWALAARAAISKVTPTRNISAYDAETYKLEFENEFEEIKEKMPPTELALFGDFLDMLLQYAKQGLDDAVGGQKSLILKMNSRRFEVGLNRPNSRPNLQGGS